MPKHILIKLTKTKYKERILKAAREKQQLTYKGNLICLTADLSAETLQAIREWQDIKYWMGKIYNQDYCTYQGSHSNWWEKKKKRFTKKKKLGEFSTTTSFTANVKETYIGKK